MDAVWMGVLPFAGYDLTVVGASEGEVRRALHAARKKAIANGGAFDVVPPGENPLEYHGVRIHQLTPGEVEWL